MKELILLIAKALVDNPDQVVVQEFAAQQTLVLELSVAKEDLGKIIGKKGRTVTAMRTILSCASAKRKKRAILEIVEE
ncbi:putative RNA-binding protein (KH-type 1 domain protein) [Desulforapulum autotrophicum HRM2]|uniref:RNA-binding protein KhpA n=1 Tax=Desulforapulum autotrophicum (strain ATCC 43914 / DSM 3382 / VKM B-1955 / HRM2) TaxID=177437 RepID=C0QEA4_DESAH|nr:KH domain-containing protein [Desulforapulum autotrophicum]ACN13221.1 putative RNA-binding protein (KH-type 1 domain protein) [Desulforapulum autotrophicum HRM2]